MLLLLAWVLSAVGAAASLVWLAFYLGTAKPWDNPASRVFLMWSFFAVLTYVQSYVTFIVMQSHPAEDWRSLAFAFAKDVLIISVTRAYLYLWKRRKRKT